MLKDIKDNEVEAYVCESSSGATSFEHDKHKVKKLQSRGTCCSHYSTHIKFYPAASIKPNKFK